MKLTPRAKAAAALFGIAAVMTLVLMLAFVSGCAQSGDPTTKPSIITVTTRGEIVYGEMVQVLTDAKTSGLIDAKTYHFTVLPLERAADDAFAKAREHAASGDAPAWQAALDTAAAFVAKLQPIYDTVRAGKPVAPKG